MTEPELFARMQDLDRIERTSYAEKGRICLAIKGGLLHSFRVNPETGEKCSLTEWIRLAAPWGYATCFAAMRDVEELKDIPMKDLSQVPESNIRVLTQLSTAVRANPAVIQAAKSKRSDEFIEHIQKTYPTQHIETSSVLRFMANETQKADIQEALTMAMEDGATSKTEALWKICIDYKASALLERYSKELI